MGADDEGDALSKIPTIRGLVDIGEGPLGRKWLPAGGDIIAVMTAALPLIVSADSLREILKDFSSPGCFVFVENETKGCARRARRLLPGRVQQKRTKPMKLKGMRTSDAYALATCT